MSARPAVLEITAETVRTSAGGTGGCPPRALVNAALEWIDDPVGLLDERPTAVADMWRSLVVTLLGRQCESVVVVHPEDWSAARVDRVIAAANTVADQIEAVSRDRWICRSVQETTVEPSGDAGLPASGVRRLAKALLVGTVVMLAAWWVGAGQLAPEETGRTVVEGRIAVRIPSLWEVHRITGGPGSRRLQAGPSGDPDIALHVTSSYAPEVTLPQAAEVIARAIAGAPPGVFGDVRSADTIAGRPAVTYRENRPGRVIRWAVVLAGSLRIGVGCQSPPGREGDVLAACEEAVRSAQEMRSAQQG